MSDDGGKTTMNILEKHTYQSTALPDAPERLTRAEAEADERRGVELAAYMSLLPTLTVEQWDAALSAAWSAARGAAWGEARGAAWVAGRVAATIVARDLISGEQFAALTAPMRAAGIDFDNLGGTP